MSHELGSYRKPSSLDSFVFFFVCVFQVVRLEVYDQCEGGFTLRRLDYEFIIDT